MRIALFTLLFTLTASAQTFEQSTAQRLHETPMGARSTAMGGSSEALTPDGTDLASNPSLIASLKNTTYSLSGAQTSYGVMRIDAAPDYFAFNREGREARALSHVAAVIPMRGFVLGVYARQDPTLRDGPSIHPAIPISLTYGNPCIDEPCDYAYAVGPAQFEHRDRRYGLTAAMERGTLALGVGAELQDLDESYDVWRIAMPQTIPFMERLTRHATTRKFVPNAGVRWRVTPRVALAAAYNGAARVDRSETACLGSKPEDACFSNTVTLDTATTVRGADAYRASVTVAPSQNIVLIAEGVRRNYSNVPNDAVFYARNRDVTELHAGGEYRFRRVPVALRAGWWREPAKVANDPYNFFGPEEATVQHRTVGAGIEVGNGARIDLAYDDGDGPSQRSAVVGVAFRTGH